MKLLPLSKNQFALVDDEDYEGTRPFHWSATWMDDIQQYRAVSHIHGQVVQLARFIMSAEKGEYIDHRNLNTLDNRRENLRRCKPYESARNRRKLKSNTSGFIGVSWHSPSNSWQATLRSENFRWCAFFKDKIEAAKARDVKAKKLHGEFAVLNFPIL